MSKNTVRIAYTGDARDLKRASTDASRSLDHVHKTGTAAFHGLKTAAAVGIGGAIAGLYALGKAAKIGWGEFEDASKVAAQTNAVIKSTGSIAHVTAKHVDKLANAILGMSGIDDEAVKSGENMLLTFKNIRNEVGKGNDIFDQTTQAVTDMDVAMSHGNSTSESMSKTAIRVGKALNDPIKGVTALAKVGVTFSEQQKEQIKHLVETGHTMEAQKLILRELTSEFGGSAKALGDTVPGQLHKLREGFNNIAGAVVGKVVPGLLQFAQFVAPAVNKAMQGIGSFINREVAPALARVGAVVKEKWPAIKQIVGDVFGTIVRIVGPVLKDVITISLTFWKKAIEIYSSHRDQFKQIFDNLGQIVRNLWSVVGPLLKLLFTVVLPAAIRVAIPLVVAISQVFVTTSKVIKGAVLVILGIIDKFLGGMQAMAEGASHLPFIGKKFRGVAEAIGGVREQVRGLALDMKGISHDSVKIGVAFHGRAEETISDSAGHKAKITVNLRPFGEGGLRRAGGGRIPGVAVPADSVPAMLSPGEFVVTGGGERMLESMTFPGVLNWLQGAQPRHFADGGRLGAFATQTGGALGGMTGSLLSAMTTANTKGFAAPIFNAVQAMFAGGSGGGGATSTHGLVPQVLRALSFARGHGWHGSVVSGFRSHAEQAALYQRYLAGGNIAAPPGHSSHEVGQAVDVSDAGTFDVLMNRAPGGSQLFNLVPGDFNHFSVSGYRYGGRVRAAFQAGGRVAGALGAAAQPVIIPTPPPSRIIAIRKKIVALRRRERALEKKLAAINSQLAAERKKKKPNKAAIKSLEKQQKQVAAELARVKNELRALGEQASEAISHDYSVIPAALQYEEAKATLTETPADDITALRHQEAYLQSQLKRKGLTLAQKTSIINALVGVRTQLKDLTSTGGEAAATDIGEGPGAEPGVETGAEVGPNPDLEAQLAQAKQQAAVAQRSAGLANAFVSTGVFGSSTPGGGGQVLVFPSVFPPTPEMVRQAASVVAQGAAQQGYVQTSSQPLGV